MHSNVGNVSIARALGYLVLHRSKSAQVVLEFAFGNVGRHLMLFLYSSHRGCRRLSKLSSTIDGGVPCLQRLGNCGDDTSLAALSSLTAVFLHLSCLLAQLGKGSQLHFHLISQNHTHQCGVQHGEAGH